MALLITLASLLVAATLTTAEPSREGAHMSYYFVSGQSRTYMKRPIICHTQYTTYTYICTPQSLPDDNGKVDLQDLKCGFDYFNGGFYPFCSKKDYRRRLHGDDDGGIVIDPIPLRTNDAKFSLVQKTFLGERNGPYGFDCRVYGPNKPLDCMGMLEDGVSRMWSCQRQDSSFVTEGAVIWLCTETNEQPLEPLGSMTLDLGETQTFAGSTYSPHKFECLSPLPYQPRPCSSNFDGIFQMWWCTPSSIESDWIQWACSEIKKPQPTSESQQRYGIFGGLDVCEAHPDWCSPRTATIQQGYFGDGSWDICAAFPGWCTSRGRTALSMDFTDDISVNPTPYYDEYAAFSGKTTGTKTYQGYWLDKKFVNHQITCSSYFNQKDGTCFDKKTGQPLFCKAALGARSPTMRCDTSSSAF